MSCLGENPFKCNQCEQVFLTNLTLETGEKTYWRKAM